MDREHIENQIKSVIADIQKASQLACPPLDATTKPALDVPEFSSPIWIAATTMISGVTGINIPDDVNLFYDKKEKAETSISQIVEQLIGLGSKKSKKELAK